MAEEEYVEAGATDMDAMYAERVDQNEYVCNEKLVGGRAAEAIPEVLSNNIIGCKNEELKRRMTDVMQRLLTGVKEAGVKSVVDSLDMDQLDVLMKYVYRLLETGKDCQILLKWHEAAYAKGGDGCIVRVICERRGI